MERTRRTPAEALQFLRDTADLVLSPKYRPLAFAILDEPEFATAWGESADADHHHSYPGGLVVHSAEVLDYCLNNLRPNDQKMADLFILAAIWHDEGKRFEYGPNGEKDKIYREQLGGHLIDSAIGLAVASYRFLQPKEQDEIVDALLHILLAHHGRREWGSPVEPSTEAAMIFHHADMWSSRFGPGKERPEPPAPAVDKVISLKEANESGSNLTDIL